MHSIDSRFVIGPSDTLFADVYVRTFLPGNFTGWGREGVKMGSDVSHFNVSLIVKGQSHKTVSTDHNI